MCEEHFPAKFYALSVYIAICMTYRRHYWRFYCPFSQTIPVEAIKPFVLLYVFDSSPAVAKAVGGVISENSNITPVKTK